MTRPRLAEIRACVRCGIARRIKHGRVSDLCRDCRHIVHDLDEAERWAS